VSADRASHSRGVWRLVARREFVERAREKGFVISTAVTLVILVGFIVLTAVFNRGTTFDLAVVGQGSRSIAERAAVAGAALDVEVKLRTLDGPAAAEDALLAGEVDAAVIDGERVLVKGEPPTELVAVVQAVSVSERSRAALAAAGLSPEEVRSALEQPPLPVRALEPVDDERRANSSVATIGVIALYGQILGFGYWVASGVVEEKSSRVVEVLLATIRPSQLLRGKILGIGALGLLQLLLIGVVGLVTAQLAGSLDFPSGAFATVGLVLAWFVVGYFLYAGLFAVAGSIVNRQEDLQTTMTPLTLVIVASFFIGLTATGDPSSTIATVAIYLPFSAPLVMPSRIVLGESSALEVVASATLAIGLTIALVPIATKVYSRAVLQTARVRLRNVLRGERG
jgi:ABC-2 type transport system permease protein